MGNKLYLTPKEKQDLINDVDREFEVWKKRLSEYLNSGHYDESFQDFFNYFESSTSTIAQVHRLRAEGRVDE